MKAKVIYIIATAALTLSAFFIGKFTAPTVIKTETPTVLQTDNSDTVSYTHLLYGFQKKQAADLVFSTPVKHLFDKRYYNSTILEYVFIRTFVRYNQI